MKHKITLAFGTELVAKIGEEIEDGETLPLEDIKNYGNISTYEFNTEKEYLAFLEGVNAGVGWLDHVALTIENGKITGTW